MSWRTLLALALGSFVVAGTRASVDAQRAGAFMGSSEDPAIAYTTASLNNAVVDVNRKLQDGAIQFTFDPRSGFLRSALEALQLPVDSQLLVFSRTSLQGKRIGEQNPRALFFNDRLALGCAVRSSAGASRPSSAAVASSSVASERGRLAATCSKWPPTTRPKASCSIPWNNSPPTRRPARRSSSVRSCASDVTSQAIRSACPAC